jgi:hypothetical protein
MRALTVDWVTFSYWAARTKLPASTTSRNVRTCSRSIRNHIDKVDENALNNAFSRYIERP